ncbi:MAG TPA: hypothetical protein VHU81_02485 [Thermoanaerobaculia bacterium]|jgi:hypothetical protein|nr:hypothetical protein [Thermoanaerobaculia bacterium]
MRKAALRIVGLAFTLAALTSSAVVNAQPPTPICPLCIIGYKCCVQGQNANCIPESQPCH